MSCSSVKLAAVSAYIPRGRLSCEEIARAWGGRGAKAVASVDEDSLTMATVWGLEHVPKAFEIAGDKGADGATGPCQMVVDTSVVPHHRNTIS